MAAQPQQNKPQEVIINLKAEVQKLKEMRDAIELMKQEGKLANVNENTYRALFNQIEQTIKRMNEGIRDGAIGASGLKSIQRGFESITSSIGKMVSQEKSTGMGLTEYNKKLEEAEKTVRDQIAAIEELKKKQKELSVTEKGNPKRGQEGQIMAAARRASRAERGNKGGDTKAEALLKGGDLKGIQDGAAAGDPAATKALQLYNQELQRQADEWVELTDKIGEAREQLSQYKATLSEIKSMGAFDEKAVENLEKMGESAGESSTALKETRSQMEQTNTASIKVSSGMKKVESSAAKAAKTFIKFNVIVKLARQVLKQGIDAVVEMDKALTDMSIVTGESRDTLQSMIPTFNKLGRETGATATEVAGLTAEYMKQGRTMKDSISLAEQTAKAAKISGLSAAETTEYLTATINGFNMAAKDAARVNDVFAKLGASTATDYQDLAIALSKVSAQANTAGLSMEFTTTLLAKGLETTQEAPESIGTALKTVLARMRELSDYGTTLEDGMSVNKVERALAAVGVELRDTNGQFRDMEEIFQELGPQWDDLNTMQQQAIAQAVAGTRQQSRFLAIMQDWDRTLEISNAALEADGAAMYQHAQYAQSLEFSMNKLQTAWQGFVSALTDSDLIRNTFSFVAEIVSKLVDVLNFLNDISGGLLGTGTTLAAVGWVLVSIIKERIEAHRQETELREKQLQLATEEIAVLEKKKLQAQAETAEKQKQLDLQRQINETERAGQEQQEGFFKRIASSMKAGGEKGQRKAEEKYMKRINKLKDKQAKKEKKTGKESAKLLKKRLKEEGRLGKLYTRQAAEQEATLAEQIKARDLIKKKMEGAAEGSEEQVKLGELLAKQDAAIAQTQSNITTLKQAATEAEQTGTLTKETSLALDQASAATNTINAEMEEEATEEEGKQAIVKTASLGIEKAENTEKTKGLALSIKERLEDTKDAIVKAAGAFAESVKSLGMPAGAIAGAAVVAAIAAIIGAGISISAGNAREKKQEAVGENQNKIYENKEKKTKLSSLKDEYKTLIDLQDGGLASTEDLERLEEIEEELKEIDGTLVQTGGDLVKAIDEKIFALDEDTSKLIDENEKNVTELATETTAGEVWAHIGLGLADVLTLGIGAAAGWHGAAQDSMKKKQAREAYENEENQLALRQAAEKAVLTKMQGASEEDIKEANSKIDSIYTSVDWGQFAEDNFKNLEEMTAKFKEVTSDAAVSISQEDNISGQIEEYNKARQKMLAAGFDEESQEFKAFMSNFSNLEILKDVGDSVAKLESAGYSTAQINNLVSSLKGLAHNSEAVANVIDKLAASEGDLTEATTDLTKDMIAKRNQQSSEDLNFWSELTGYTADELKNMSASEFEGLTNEYIDKFATFAAGGINRSNIDDFRTKGASAKDNTVDLISTLQSGDKLDAEAQAQLRDNFGELYASAEFQEALKSNRTKAATMLKEAQRAQQEELVGNASTHLELEEDKQTAALKKYGLSSYDSSKGLSDAEKERLTNAGYDVKQIEAELTENAIAIQNAKDAIEELSDFSLDAEKIDTYASKWDKLTAEAEAYMEAIEEQGTATAETYAALAANYNDQAALVQGKLDETLADFAKNMNMSEEELKTYFDVVNGKLIPKAEKLNELEGEYLNYWNENSDTLGEYYSQLQEVQDAQEELTEMQRENVIAIQEQAIAAMQARLDAEYEATKKSLDKRQELYSKYFDALDAEEDAETYENDRQALLNKIAALSTATDSGSLAALKEAQEALKELDDEQLQNERDLRREAVEESFTQQGEDLDTAYDEAMANVQGLWEEFCTMAGEDQLELFRQYGEGFQEVTDLQRQIAEETLAKTMAAVDSYGYTGGKAPAFAEGGLVDYTGPAWVDGTKSRPEAFLDAVDTANIANLAQGLRALVSGSLGMSGTSDTSTITINELNINVNGSADGQAVGQDAADGFMKAMRELGININKQG